MKYTLLPASLLAALLLSACAKDDDPTAQLPPETRSGANTFGCLVNGQPWTPLGRDSYSIYYDAAYRHGTLNISTSRYTADDASQYQLITLGSDSIKSAGNYPLIIAGHQEALFIDTKTGCRFLTGDPHYRQGTLIITRLDLQAGIISGTFSFTLAKPGCDTVRVTQGRFDKKL